MKMKRKTLIEERYYGIKRRQLSFMKMVQEKVANMKTSLTPFLPNDLIFKIFLLLPIRSLLRLSCVCKSWHKLIHCAEFVEAYNNEAHGTALLLRKVEHERLDSFHVETQLKQLETFSIFPCNSAELRASKFFHFLDIEEGKSKIIDLNLSCSGSVVATCNGLVLIRSLYQTKATRREYLDMPHFNSHERPGRLIILNPMTRKFIGFPLGTLPYDYSNNESYGLVFSQSKGDYKVVHLFKDKLGFISCEVFSLQTRSWKAIDGPSGNYFQQFGYVPVSASGALHWVSDKHNVDYLVSIGADDEKFFITDLPKPLGAHDKLVEMGGFLTFVCSLDMNHVEVWVLKGLNGSEWIKQHTINIDAIIGYEENNMFVIPAFALSAKEMVFRRRDKLYSYDFELEVIREIELDGGKIQGHESLMPHSNNLATWEPLERMS